MASNEYCFETVWYVPAAPEEVSEILADPCDLVRWWPDVYLEVGESEPGVFSLLTRGWLPYTLRWHFRVAESNSPHGFTLTAWGDLEGSGIWKFTRDGDWTKVQYLWRVKAEKPILRYLSFLLKPIFEGNHRWAMERGRRSLLREVERRHRLSSASGLGARLSRGLSAKAAESRGTPEHPCAGEA